ncbi:MAG: adenine phosphoribosyltransferase [Bacteroidetes bacterium]|nr:adenine phosphoribosyltransferase [Bacteroidota bacterium]
MISDKIKKTVRDIPDFPKPGIIFKDITPLLIDFKLREELIDAFADKMKHLKIDALIGVESRGFLFGIPLANRLEIPFVPVRKAGKLPYSTYKVSYDLEYGKAEVEIHSDAIRKGSRVFIHDDLLATGGTAAASAQLVQKLGAEVAGFGFLIELSFLKGRENLLPYSHNIISLATY